MQGGAHGRHKGDGFLSHTATGNQVEQAGGVVYRTIHPVRACLQPVCMARLGGLEPGQLIGAAQGRLLADDCLGDVLGEDAAVAVVLQRQQAPVAVQHHARLPLWVRHVQQALNGLAEHRDHQHGLVLRDQGLQLPVVHFCQLADAADVDDLALARAQEFVCAGDQRGCGTVRHDGEDAFVSGQQWLRKQQESEAQRGPQARPAERACRKWHERIPAAALPLAACY